MTIALAFIGGVLALAGALWYGSLPLDSPRCGCGHRINEHDERGCNAIDVSGLGCRCDLPRATARARFA
jgi:hypothetical protein